MGILQGLYSLCMMGDFQNSLISRILSVSSSALLDRLTFNDLIWFLGF